MTSFLRASLQCVMHDVILFPIFKAIILLFSFWYKISNISIFEISFKKVLFLKRHFECNGPSVLSSHNLNDVNKYQRRAFLVLTMTQNFSRGGTRDLISFLDEPGGVHRQGAVR